MSFTDQRLQQIFREVFENDALAFSDGLSPETLPAWDSLAQVKLVMACEEEFGVKFTTDEQLEIHNAAALKSVLAAKGVAR